MTLAEDPILLATVQPGKPWTLLYDRSAEIPVEAEFSLEEPL